MQPSYWHIHGQTIEYQLWGESHRDRPLYLLLHEGLGCVALWRDFPQQLSDALQVPVLAYSRAGYGRSAPIELPRPVSYMHDEARLWLPQIIDQLQADTIRLIGHSDGASISLIYLAGEHCRQQRRVDAAFCLAPHVFAEPMTLDSIRTAREKFATTDLPERLRRYHHRNTENAFRGWCDTWLHPDFQHWNLSDLLPGIETPLSIIQGENDEYGSLEQPATIERLVPGRTEISILADCGHAPQFDQPVQTIDIVRAFAPLPG